MSMSDEAAHALRAAVIYNPAAARQLIDILRNVPTAVALKMQDRYGPLSLMIMGSIPTRQITREVEIPVKKAPFPSALLPACETFNREWLQQRFSKLELANAIEMLLTELPAEPLLDDDEIDEQTTLVFTREGTFLVNPESGMLQRLDDEENLDGPGD
jgi:hypothetical protein